MQFFRGLPHVLFPPFYSLLLAAIGSFGVDVLEAGRWVNAVAFGLTILAAGLWLRRSLESSVAGRLALGAVVVLVVSPHLNDAASRVLTESVFVLFVLLALMQLSSFLQAEGRSLLMAAAFSALAALTRYAGVALILTGVLLLLAGRGARFTDRLRHAGVFGAVASIPVALVVVRNWTVSGTLTGPRVGTGQSLADSLGQIARVVGGWVVPPNAPDWSAHLLWLTAGLLVLGVPAVAAASSWLRRGSKPDALAGYGSPSSHGDDPGEPTEWPATAIRLGPALPFVVFTLVYLVFIVAIVPLTVPFPIGNRFLVPLYVPALLAATWLLDRLLQIQAEGWMAAAKWTPVFLILVGALTHVGVSARANLRSTARALESGYVGRTYNTSYWEESETLDYIRANRIDGGTYSNNAFAVWLADRTAAPGTHDRLLALAHGTSLSGLKRGIEELGAEVKHIVWFRGPQVDRLDFSDMDIALLPGVETVADLSDGIVFRVALGPRSTRTD